MMAILYVGCFVAANLLLAHFGPGLAPVNAFLLVGLGLVARDIQHDRWSGRFLWVKMLGLIVASGAISALMNPAAGRIAVASACAVAAMGLFDAGVYYAFRGRPFLVRSNASNIVGAALDSAVFLTLAFGFDLMAICATAGAKIAGGFVWSLVASKTMRRGAACVVVVLAALRGEAANVQAHHDFDRELMTYTFETFTPTQYGNWFGFIDGDYDNELRQLYGELSYTAPFGLTVEVNGGRSQFWNDAVGLVGWQYKFVRLLWRSDGNPQITLTHQWTWRRLTLCGFADLWTEDGRTVFHADPQVWFNVWWQFDVGGEVELSHDFAGTDGWKVRPTVAARVRW
ncbi:MAG: DUF5020 family protein [Planctomycetes bacterium]|nr:DUF5020 family protein [Planctomycetota bacterium]